MNIDILKQAGIDYESGVERFLNQSNLYEAALGDFLKEKAMEQAEDAFTHADLPELEQCSHTIKGMAANMDMKPLFESARALNNLLKTCINPDSDIVERLFLDMKIKYYTVYNGIISAQDN